MKKFLFPFLALSLVLTAPYAQSQSSTVGGQDTNSNGDCSDPLNAGSSLCNPGSQIPLNQNSSGQQRNPFGNSPTSRPDNNSNFTDNEDLATRLQSRYRSGNTIQLPREPLTEFQKFVASTTGQVLPIFGANLFRSVPSTFAPLDLTPVPPDYVIGPGDELRIRVWGQINFNADVRVDRSGQVYLPQIGQVHVAGLSYSNLHEHLRSAVGRIYRNFDLTADVGQIRAVQVYVVGQARRPGLYTISSLSTLVDALFASGGPSIQGSMRHIQLKRGGSVIVDFDLYALLVHGDTSNDAKLLNGDVLYIPPVGPQVAVTGSVREPALYELRASDTLGDTLSNAGGASNLAAETRISIERITEHHDRQAVEVGFDAASLASPVKDGDILRVFPIVPAYGKTVILRGNTANPGRFSWHPGMRLSDLIPDRESLITRNYWWKRTQLGLPAPEFEPLDRFPNLRQPNFPIDLPRPNQQAQRLDGRGYPYPQGASQTYPNSSSPDGSDNQIDGISGQQQQQQQNSQQYPYPNSQVPYSQDPNNPQYVPNGSYPNGYPYGSRASQSGSNSSLGGQQGEQNEPLPQNTPEFARQNDVRLSVPEIDWDYAVIERLDRDTLKSSLIPFDLGKLVMQHDSSQDMELQPGDVVTVFSQGDIHVPLDQQTKYIRLEGEVAHSGVYSVNPGETLRDIVRRAGGFTPNAYLYGSEFTRDSTRVIQQHRIDEYVQNLQLQISRGSLALASSPTSSSQDIASGAAAQSAEQDLIARLTKIRATGRIVLEFNPGSGGVDIVPPLALENGDRFVVPAIPASINVVGAVYDQNSFLFRSERRVHNYLQLAGGPNRDADVKHMFIIRADGSVVSHKAANGVWGNTFESLPINPGDTIVVPEKTLKPSAMRGFLEWSQLFSQLALGAAAINVIQ